MLQLKLAGLLVSNNPAICASSATKRHKWLNLVPSRMGRTLMFGENSGAAVRVTMRDERCVMVNLHPDTAERDSEVMKTIVRMNDNYAGVYGTAIGAGELRVGQVVTLGD
jgi:MOSC domain